MGRFIPITFIICTLLLLGDIRRFINIFKLVIIRYKKYCSKINLREELHNLSPREFELWCCDFLRGKGYSDVAISPSGPDGGVDIKCLLNGEKIYVECKRYSFRKNAEFMVNKDIVRKLVGAMEGDNIKHGMIITTGIVTTGALEFIKTLPEEYKIDIFDSNSFDIVYAVNSFDFCLIR